MPDLSNPYRGGPSDVGVLAGSSTGISIAAPVSVNAKNTTWTELIAATTHETTWVVVTLTDASTAGAGYLIDIGVGAAAAEVVLIPDLFIYTAVVAQPIPRVYSLPIAIPKGTRISARCQSSTTVATVRVGIQVFSSPITGQHGLRRVETAGVAASSLITLLNDPGATPHTDGTWTQLLAATTFHWKWMCAVVFNTDNITAAISSHLVDIGVGAGAAEVAVVNDLWFLSHTGTDNPVPGTYCFPCAIASGSRVAARDRESTGTAGDRRIGLALYGVG